MKKEIKAEILIEANPEKIWSVLSDFENYPNWNPFIRSIRGELKKGNTIHVKLQPDGGKGMDFSPKILEAENNKLFCWKGKVLIPGLFDGKHRFELKDLGNGKTLFIQSEKFTGILVRFFSKMLDGPTLRSFHKMNEQLRLICEKK